MHLRRVVVEPKLQGIFGRHPDDWTCLLSNGLFALLVEVLERLALDDSGEVLAKSLLQLLRLVVNVTRLFRRNTLVGIPRLKRNVRIMAVFWSVELTW